MPRVNQEFDLIHPEGLVSVSMFGVISPAKIC